MKVWLTSDTHFGHKKIIDYCGRPYETVTEMDENIIERWNEVVAPEDTVWHLGDVGFMPRAALKEIVSKLNGRKHLILGNHDGTRQRMLDVGFLTAAQKWVVDDVMLIHNPAHVLEGWAGPVFCGHVHTKWLKFGRKVNVGVDQWRFKPVAWEVALEMASYLTPAEAASMVAKHRACCCQETLKVVESTTMVRGSE